MSKITFAVQPERDMAFDDDAGEGGTRFEACEEAEAEHFALYRVVDGVTDELVDDYPTRVEAERAAKAQSAHFDDPDLYHAPEARAALIAKADAIEVGGCCDVPDEDSDDVCAEPCDDDEATYWSAYAHVPGEGAACLADFRTRAEAETYAASFGLPVVVW